MWCTTECWNCENKTCEHYISKQDIYFKYNKLRYNWNSLKEWLGNLIDNFQEDVSIPILHEQMTIRLVYEYIENLDKINELKGDNNDK